MEKVNKIENNKFNYYKRASSGKSDDGNIVSKITDYQTSMSAFSTKTSINNLSSTELKEKVKNNKSKKRVEFNPFITVINIQSYKKENFIDELDNKNRKVKKCVLCSII